MLSYLCEPPQHRKGELPRPIISPPLAPRCILRDASPSLTRYCSGATRTPVRKRRHSVAMHLIVGFKRSGGACGDLQTPGHATEWASGEHQTTWGRRGQAWKPTQPRASRCLLLKLLLTASLHSSAAVLRTAVNCLAKCAIWIISPHAGSFVPHRSGDQSCEAEQQQLMGISSHVHHSRISEYFRERERSCKRSNQQR